MSLSGKGNSSAQTSSTTNVSNQQVATESGIAVGAGAKADISITSSDPETVKNALLANAGVTGAAFNFAGHAADVAADTNKFAISAVNAGAETSILAQNSLATKFGAEVSDLAAQNINLLQSVGQQQSDVAINSQKIASDALDKSFAVSRAVAPQDANYTSSETSKYMLYAVVAIAVVFGAIAVFRKRS